MKKLMYTQTEQPWSFKDQLLMDYIFTYVNNLPNTAHAYKRIIDEINLGPTSPRALTGELQDYLLAIKETIEDPRFSIKKEPIVVDKTLSFTKPSPNVKNKPDVKLAQTND